MRYGGRNVLPKSTKDQVLQINVDLAILGAALVFDVG